jgi:hypothetical protein
VKYNPREKFFAEMWEEENKPRPGIDYGFGILQDLFIESQGQFGLGTKCLHKISAEEAMITATAIQWLGSNCGFAFLQEVLNKCGYRIKKKETK